MFPDDGAYGGGSGPHRAGVQGSVAELQDSEFLPRPGRWTLEARLERLPDGDPQPKDSEATTPDRRVASASSRFPLAETQRRNVDRSADAAGSRRPASCLHGLYLDGDLDVEELLRRAIRAVVQRHEGPRCTFSEDGTEAVLRPVFRPEVPVHDLSSLPEPEREARVNEILHQEGRRLLDLAAGPLAIFKILKLSPGGTCCLHGPDDRLRRLVPLRGVRGSGGDL